MSPRTTADHRLELIVGDAPGPRSGMWRFIATGDDIYVQFDGARNDLKTSLHASGSNHHAWTRVGRERWDPDGDRYTLQWGEPEPFAPGGRNLLGIVIPSDHLQVPEKEPPLEQREKITLLAPAPDGQATFVYVALTAPDTELVGSAEQPLAILACWPLATRGWAWIVAMHGPWDGFRAAVTATLPVMQEKFAGELRDKLTPGKRKELRAVLTFDPDAAGVAPYSKSASKPVWTDGSVPESPGTPAYSARPTALRASSFVS